MQPSRKSLRRLRERIYEETSRKWQWKSAEELARSINPLLIGWANYFRVGAFQHAWGSVDHYVFQRLRQWWCATAQD
jgi:RNA-directed DNA polymerase